MNIKNLIHCDPKKYIDEKLKDSYNYILFVSETELNYMRCDCGTLQSEYNGKEHLETLMFSDAVYQNGMGNKGEIKVTLVVVRAKCPKCGKETLWFDFTRTIDNKEKRQLFSAELIK